MQSVLSLSIPDPDISFAANWPDVSRFAAKGAADIRFERFEAVDTSTARSKLSVVSFILLEQGNVFGNHH